MDADTYPDGAVKKLLNEFVLVKVNTDEGAADIKKVEELTGKEVSGIPDARILTPDGEHVDNVIGFVPPAEFAKWLEQALAKLEKK